MDLSACLVLTGWFNDYIGMQRDTGKSTKLMYAVAEQEKNHNCMSKKRTIIEKEKDLM